MVLDRKTILLILGFFLVVFLGGCLFGPAGQLSASENRRVCNRLNEVTGSFSGTICAGALERDFPLELNSLPRAVQEQRQEGIERKRIYSFLCNPDNLESGVTIEKTGDCADSEKICQQDGATASCGEEPESAGLPAIAKEYNRRVCERLLEKTGANDGTVCASTIDREFRSLILPSFLSELSDAVRNKRIYSFQCNPNDLEAGFHLNTVSDCGTGNECMQTSNSAKCKSSIEAEAQPKTCVTPEGKSGVTGPNAVPLISFSSNWNDFEKYGKTGMLPFASATSNATQQAWIAALKLNNFSGGGDKTFFLDAEQFLMVLFWNLHEKADQPKPESFSFFALLKQDHFSSKQLLTKFAKQESGFANTPQWFRDEQSPFYKLLENSSMLEVQQPQSPSIPGLYRIDVSFESVLNAQQKPYPLFYQRPDGQTLIGITKIRIELIPIETDFLPSPLYYISLDAASNPTGRDFGNRFTASESANTEPLLFLETLSTTAFSQGATETKILVVKNFETLNSNSPRVIATISSNGSSFFFFPQQAVALAAMPNSPQQAGLAYYFVKDAKAWQSTGTASLLSWNFTASAKSCSAFTPNRNAADAATGNCIENSSIKGFEIARPTPNPIDYPIGTSIVTVPPGEQFAIKTCETESKGAKLATPKGTSNGSALDLVAEERFTIQTVEQLLNSVKEGKVCVVNSENETAFSWNQGAFKEQQHAAAEKLQSGLQWCENCPISESLLNEVLEYVKQNNPDLAARVAGEQSCSVQG